jgi:pimeloyl-ACP methyl ester carboxylesterase
MKKSKRKWKFIAFGLLGIVCIGTATVLLLGAKLCAPCPQKIGNLPNDLKGNNVAFPGSSGANIKGWFIQGRRNRGCVILMHAIRGNRLSMLERARFLNVAGYSVLLFDFRAHGESQGNHITFGYRESEDAKAALHFIKTKMPGEKIAVIGVSLGGAAAILAHPPLKVDAVVLEMVYPRVEQAVVDRLSIRFGKLGPFLAPLFLWQLKPRLGVSAVDLRPIDKIAQINVPKLFIAGSADRHTTLVEAKELFDRASKPKEFWAIKGASHVDFHQFSNNEYEKRVLSFLNKNL